MFPSRDGKLTKIALVLFFIIVILYGIYEAQGILFGPKIYTSTERTTVYDPYVKIEGKAERITSLAMNGKQIPVTESGEFSEPFLLAKGDNRIALEAKDTYGRVTSSYVDIMYMPYVNDASESTTPSL